MNHCIKTLYSTPADFKSNVEDNQRQYQSYDKRYQNMGECASNFAPKTLRENEREKNPRNFNISAGNLMYPSTQRSIEPLRMSGEAMNSKVSDRKEFYSSKPTSAGQLRTNVAKMDESLNVPAGMEHCGETNESSMCIPKFVNQSQRISKKALRNSPYLPLARECKQFTSFGSKSAPRSDVTSTGNCKIEYQRRDSQNETHDFQVLQSSTRTARKIEGAAGMTSIKQATIAQSFINTTPVAASRSTATYRKTHAGTSIHPGVTPKVLPSKRTVTYESILLPTDTSPAINAGIASHERHAIHFATQRSSQSRITTDTEEIEPPATLRNVRTEPGQWTPQVNFMGIPRLSFRVYKPGVMKCFNCSSKEYPVLNVCIKVEHSVCITHLMVADKVDWAAIFLNPEKYSSCCFLCILAKRRKSASKHQIQDVPKSLALQGKRNDNLAPTSTDLTMTNASIPTHNEPKSTSIPAIAHKSASSCMKGTPATDTAPKKSFKQLPEIPINSESLPPALESSAKVEAKLVEECKQESAMNLQPLASQKKQEIKYDNPTQYFQSDDKNFDHCSVCGDHGRLLCCDQCPRAFHLGCIGLTPRAVPSGDWICSECERPPFCIETIKALKNNMSLKESVLRICDSMLKQDFIHPFRSQQASSPKRCLGFDCIRKKAASDEYSTLDAFVDDVNAIWAHCASNNRKKSLVARMGLILSNNFRALIAAILNPTQAGK